MSKLSRSAATAQKLSITAMEEASRFGQRTADIDHLLIALTVNEETAGQILRSLGVTIEATREAVSAENTHQLASLGIHADLPSAGPIVFHQTSGYEWSNRGSEIFKRASEGAKRVDASAILRELVIEPSGTIEAILCRLGTTPETVTELLDGAERYLSDDSVTPTDEGFLSGSMEAFIPAAPEQVWALVADPSRLPQWLEGIASIDTDSDYPRVGAVWEARSSTQDLEGKSLRVKPDAERQRVRLDELEPERLVQWSFIYPDNPKANSRRICIELEPASAGTQLRILSEWVRTAPHNRRAFLGFLRRPFYRLIIWMQLLQISSGISRVFR